MKLTMILSILQNSESPFATRSPNPYQSVNKYRQGTPKGKTNTPKSAQRKTATPPTELPSARKSIDKPDGIFKYERF